MASRLPLIFSVPTSAAGATPAATFAFFSVGYKPPRQNRDTAIDRVHNQNGVFNYVYDNGPGAYEWDQFQIEINDAFANGEPGSADTQWANLQFLWNFQGPIGFAAPEGVYSVGWAAAPLERQFARYPGSAGDKIVTRVVINLQEE